LAPCGPSATVPIVAHGEDLVAHAEGWIADTGAFAGLRQAETDLAQPLEQGLLIGHGESLRGSHAPTIERTTTPADQAITLRIASAAYPASATERTQVVLNPHPRPAWPRRRVSASERAPQRVPLPLCHIPTAHTPRQPRRPASLSSTTTRRRGSSSPPCSPTTHFASCRPRTAKRAWPQPMRTART